MTAWKKHCFYSSGKSYSLDAEQLNCKFGGETSSLNLNESLEGLACWLSFKSAKLAWASPLIFFLIQVFIQKQNWTLLSLAITFQWLKLGVCVFSR